MFHEHPIVVVENDVVGKGVRALIPGHRVYLRVDGGVVRSLTYGADVLSFVCSIRSTLTCSSVRVCYLQLLIILSATMTAMMTIRTTSTMSRMSVSARPPSSSVTTSVTFSVTPDPVMTEVVESTTM